jgi:hypothetical protein
MPRPAPVGPDVQDEIARLYLQGHGRNELATRFGLRNRTYVSHLLRRRGIPIRSSVEVRRPKLRHDAFASAGTDDEAAYWTGFLMTDGCVSVFGPNTTYVILVLAKRDAGHLESFLRFLGANNRIREVPDGSKKTRGGLVRVDIASKELAADLARYGVVPRKTLTAEVRHLENNRHFWRGAIDGDGSIHTAVKIGRRPRPVLQFCGSERLVTQFAEFAARHTPTRARPHRGKGREWAVGFACGLALELIDLLYRDCAVALPRKMALARSIIENYRPAWRRGSANCP